VWLDGKGHDLKGCDDRLAEEVSAWVTMLAGRRERERAEGAPTSS